MKHLIAVCLLLFTTFSFAQNTAKPKDESWKKIYRAFPEKVNDLVHTKIEARFNYAKSQMMGKAYITLQPHFYTTNTVTLDAKGMDINKVELVKLSKNTPLKYEYDGMLLNITLDRPYRGGEKYTLFIDYVAKPNELKVQGSAAIADAKGLYFINPTGEDKDKPIQIWTQGETEATSVWVPTIDKPNQKTTQETYMTVPAKYVTLSNGKLMSQKLNPDGTRTDYWKMDLPHAPYLFFMGVGDYAIVKDTYKGKEVNYYVEKEYKDVAKKIFGNTPEMMAYFSKITGVEYPWIKYSQMVARDYVSGAMENTTAVLHQESAQQDARQLIDGNEWEGTIAHELFHHWFGDYVTCESWSNLTVNESFANYSQVLWKEYKYGKDAGDEENFNDMQGYLLSGSGSKDLVRFYYRDKEDMFDAVSYNKGGRILHMLRNFVGDDAFFASLKKYLTDNKFGTGNAQQLRLAFEAVTGKDLNWYFNQWYYGSGHPTLDITYTYFENEKNVQVIVKQTQSGDKVFKMPVNIDVYQGAKKVTYNVWLDNKADTFYFAATTKPDLVNFDADKILLCTKKENKTLAEYIHQYKYAGKYLDRKEAIDFAAKKIKEPEAVAFLTEALNDKYAPLREKVLQALAKTTPNGTLLAKVSNMATNDANSLVRAEAIDFLAASADVDYKNLFIKATTDSSYSVAGAGLEALAEIDSAMALQLAGKFSKEKNKGRLSSAINNILTKYGDESAYDIIAKNFEALPVSQAKFQALQGLANILVKVTDEAKFKRGIDLIVEFREAIPESVKNQTNPYINNMILKGIATKKAERGEQALANYVTQKIN
jgi:aminopeptidase N